MYSIPENLDATEFSGWINQGLLLKDNHRSTDNRKRRYNLTNVDIRGNCQDGQCHALRPRHNSISSPGASRTRPIRSNRVLRRQNAISLTDEEFLSIQRESSMVDVATSNSANELPIIEAMVSLSQQTYLAAPSDLSLGMQESAQTPLNVNNLGPEMHQLDPWVMHNYLLATSGYYVANRLSSDPNLDSQNMNLTQLPYHSVASNNVMTHNLMWQYPYPISLSYNHLHNHLARPSEHIPHPLSHQNIDAQSDLSYLYRLTNLSERNHTSNPGVVHSHSPRFEREHLLPNHFNFVAPCPFHHTSNIVQTSQHPSNQRVVPEQPLISSSASFDTFLSSPEITFGQYWHEVMRPVDYSVNSTNIDTLLHLAAHFEQRKRGITREELEKLPTHRHKVSAERAKRTKMCMSRSKTDDTEDDSQKCLVCLEDFESKQSIRTLRCNHEFHAKCIDKWLKINRTCPLCRADSIDGSAQADAPR